MKRIQKSEGAAARLWRKLQDEVFSERRALLSKAGDEVLLLLSSYEFSDNSILDEVKQELAARGRSPDQIEGEAKLALHSLAPAFGRAGKWRPFAVRHVYDLNAPGELEARAHDMLAADYRRTRRANRVSQIWNMLSFYMILIAIPALGLMVLDTTLGLDRWIADPAMLQVAAMVILGFTIMLVAFWLSYLVYYLFAQISPRNPRRILILRPFNDGKISRPLKRFIRRHVSGFGFCYSLSDADFRERRFLYVLVSILTSLSYALPFLTAGVLYVVNDNKRMKYVKNNASYRSLLKLLNRKRDLWFLLPPISLFAKPVSWWWAVRSGNVMVIGSSDEWWKTCVRTLAGNCDSVVMDVSDLRPGSQWEIENLERLTCGDNIVFVANDAHRSHVDAFSRGILARYFPGKPIFFYNEKGVPMEEGDAFEDAVLQSVVRNWVERPAMRQDPPRKDRKLFR